MKLEDFRVDGFYQMTNWGGLEVMVESEDYVRYREVTDKESEKYAKVSRPCRIYSTIKNCRAYFNYRGTRIHLDEVMNSHFLE